MVAFDDLDALRQALGVGQTEHLVEILVQIARFEFELPRTAVVDQLGGDLIELFDLVDNHTGKLAERVARRKFGVQVLDGHHDDGERIAYLVGHTSSHFR